MHKILSVGNSFSQDAHAYIHDMANAGGERTYLVNLYIGGCSLSAHADNAKSGLSEYDFEVNGKSTGQKISLPDALKLGKWDFITFQQASYDSGKPETYFPYLTDLISLADDLSPDSETLIHQTWAYETDSTHEAFPDYSCDQKQMFEALVNAYEIASLRTGKRNIPSGEAIQYLRSFPEFDYPNGGRSLCRDGFHMDLIYGRFALACVWCATVLNMDILKNKLILEGMDERLASLIKSAVHEVCAKYS